MKNRTATVRILGVSFSTRSKETTYALLRTLLKKRANARVFTPNPEILWLAHRDPDQKRLLQSAHLLLPDGVGVLLAARLTGVPLPEKITGIDTGEWILQYAANHSLSVFLLGGKRGVADQARRVLCDRFPTLRICDTQHGYFDKTKESEENRQVVQKIRQAAPDVLFVCFGFPAQERWIVENTPDLPSLRLSMGLGGAFDVWSGNLPRAPKAFRACGLEWLWRTLKEPKRLRRLRYIPAFLHAVLTSRK